MSKKHVYVYSVDEVEYGGGYYCTEAERVGTAREFNRARFEAAIAADELRERGNGADVQTVYNALIACDIAMPEARTERTNQNLYACIRYIEDCKRGGAAVYWPYVQNRLLDFLEPVHFSAEYMEV